MRYTYAMSPLQIRAARSRKHLITYAASLAFVAASLLLFAEAATNTSQLEAETGTLTRAAVITESSASAGKAVRFSNTPSGLVHPGVFVSGSQLDYVKQQVNNSKTPWITAYNSISSRYTDSTYIPSPVSLLDCTADATGCSKIVDDSIAAYTQSLMYYISTATDRSKHAQAAIRIMNAWSSTLASSNGNQAALTLAWSGEVMPRAAEIIRYAYTPSGQETPLNTSKLIDMFQNIYAPRFDPALSVSTSSNGNWQLSMANALVSIAVFSDNKQQFNDALTIWRARVPAYIYMSSDGTNPVYPSGGVYNDPVKLRCFWLGSGSPTTSCTVPPSFSYATGMTQETCRDISHTVMGLSSMVYAAETARIQGVDLYGEQKERIKSALEFNANFFDQYLSTGTWPTLPCGGKPTNGDGAGGTAWKLGWEAGYNAYANRMGVPMPETLNIINRVRPTGGVNQFAWETLTSVNNPN